MSNLNKVILSGNMVADADIRVSGDGNKVARCRIAVQRRFAKEGQERESDFINLVAFGRQAEFAERFVKKGSKFAVVGRIQTGSYTNQEGVKVYTTDVIVDEWDFASSRSADSSDGAAAAPANASSVMPEPDGGFSVDEEIPFN